MTEKIFISYKREEQAFAQELRDDLRSWQHQVWLDVDDIPAGVSPDDKKGWDRAIHEGLKSARIVVGVITPAALESDNVLDEWGWALDNQRRLILLRLREFNPEEMLPRYNRIQYIDLVSDKSRGLKRLKETLASPVKLSQEQIGRAAPVASPVPKTPPEIPPEPVRPLPWSLTFQVLAVLTFVAALIWMVAQPGFEPLLAFLGAVTAQLLAFASRPQAAIKLSDRDLMLDRVRNYWIKGVLRPALSDREALTIRHQFKPELVLKSANTGDYRLPPDAQIVDIFNEINQELLILGDPGAGKTVMLLQLADGLIDQAQADPRKPIPVVLNLASWALKREALDEWIVVEMGKVYQVGAGVAREWLKNNRLLLLLDGLDEVKEEYCDACVLAINDFRREYDFVRLAVCSRILDYEKLSTRLNLFVIVLEPLTQAQIDDYLAAGDLANVRRLIANDAILQEMAQTPFLLNTMAYAYHDLPEIGLASTFYERRTHLFNEYITRRFQDATGKVRFSLKDSREYLTWLATKMQAYVQTVFYLDDLDQQWLRSNERQHWAFWGVLGALVLIPLALAYGAVGLLGSGVWAALVLMVAGLAVGLLGLFLLKDIGHIERVRFIGFRPIAKQIGDKGNRFMYALLSAAALLPTIPGLLSPWWLSVIAVAVLVMVVILILARDGIDDIGDFALYAGGALAGGAVLGLYAAVLSHLIPLGWLGTGLLTWVITTVITIGLLVFEPQALPVKTAANAGTLSALRSAVAVGLWAGLIWGVLGGLLHGVWFGLAMGAAFGLSLNLFYGGMTLLQHLALRLTLSVRGDIPPRLLAFVRAMTTQNILRMVGGGYIFRHRYLLEHFASPTDVIADLIVQLPGEKAEEALAEMGPVALESLSVTLRDMNVRAKTRAAAGRALGKIADPRPGVLAPKGVPQFVWCEVPAGKFKMGGDPKAANQWDGAEFSLPYLFWIAKYPVTYAQYEPFVAATGRKPAGYWNDPQWHIANHPVVGMTWKDAYAYTQWLNEQRIMRPENAPGNYIIRLPRECEWEKTARYPDGRLFPWGNEWDSARLNSYESGIRRTSAVGIFPNGANPTHGACDLSGNVREWCLTEWAEKYTSPDAEKNDPQGDALRCARGGSWSYFVNLARAAARVRYLPGGWDFDGGFRVVLSASL